MVPSLLQTNEALSEQDNTARVQLPLNQIYSTQIDEQPQTHLDVSLRVPYSSKVSSPLKLSYIPEPISESEEDIQFGNTESSVTNDNDIEKVVVFDLPEEKSNDLNEDPLENGPIEFTVESEGQQGNLLEPINHFKELLQDQSSESDNVPEFQSENYSHSFDTSSDIHSTTHTDAEYQTSDVSDVSSSQLSTKTLRKDRVPPVALISADIRQVRSCVQRTNAYAAKLELLSREDTGLHLWLNLNREKEPPSPVKNYKKGNRSSTLASAAANKIYSNPVLATATSSQPALSSSQTLTDNSADADTPVSLSSSKSSKSTVSLRTSLDIPTQTSPPRSRPSSPPISPKLKTSTNFANFVSMGRHGSSNKTNRPSIIMPPPVMNDPAVNSSLNSPTSSSKSSKSLRQRRFSFQSVSSRFSFGQSSPSPNFPTTVEEKNDSNSSGSVIVDEIALNKLCDVLPHEDRDVLANYLRAAGGKDDLMAVGLYMKDLKGGDPF